MLLAVLQDVCVPMMLVLYTRAGMHIEAIYQRSVCVYDAVGRRANDDSVGRLLNWVQPAYVEGFMQRGVGKVIFPTPLFSKRLARLGPHRCGRFLLAQLQQLALAEAQLATVRVHHDRVASFELALEDLAREPRLDHALDGAAQWAGAVGRHIPLA